MEAFGYDKNDEEFDNILELSQVTLRCKRDELDKIIEFLNNTKKEIKNIDIEFGDHWHYRDYDESWNEEEPDLIIYMTDDTNKI